jgi:RND family efflux transporter MFP subunit
MKMSDLSEHTVNKASRPNAGKKSGVKWIALGIALVAVLAFRWIHPHSSVAQARALVAPTVVVSPPLSRELDSGQGFLGQFSAIEQVELRAQVGGTLVSIHFKDGDIVHKGDLLFVIDEEPYQIRVAQATAQFESAESTLELANQELARAQGLRRSDAGSQENVEQRSADQRAAVARVDGAKAQMHDARFDLEHCRITAPFTGRIGSHQVSVGNLIAGSRAASSPTTLLATMVSLDPVWINFDMSESDYLVFSREQLAHKGPPTRKVELALGDEKDFGHAGVLDFVDNVMDRSSGTLHARATIPNPTLLLTPGEFARVRLALRGPVPTLLVPDAVILPDQSEHLVLTVAADGTVVAKPVEIGDLREGLRVIRSGLTPNDRVIIEGLPFASPGSKVTARDGAIQLAANSP